MDETVTPWKFNVEGELGLESDERIVLTKMVRIAYENRKLLRLPVIRKLKEVAPRQGFFEREQFLAVRGHLLVNL